MSKPAKSLLTAPLKSKVVPARSKLVVNKSIMSLGAKKANREKAKSGAVEKSDEVFADNLEMALALLPTVPFKRKNVSFVHRNLNLSSLIDSTVVRKWISKLLQDPAVTKDKRNAHLSFLVFQMQNMKISDPFDKEPPQSLVDGAKIFSVSLCNNFES